MQRSCLRFNGTTATTNWWRNEDMNELKSAEEWRMEIKFRSSVEPSIETIKQIQLNALNAARDCIIIDGNPEVARDKINKLILSARDRKESL